MTALADIRKDYKMQTLNEVDVEISAIKQFEKWWNDAVNSEIDEVNAMTIVTATKEGKPSARIVLLKGFDDRGFVFFSNYNSHKGKELSDNPQACMVFFWKELERQIRIEGRIEKISSEESDAYFLSRPVSSQIGAWSSPQSEVILNRKVLEDNVTKFGQQFSTEALVRPENWGGYCLKPDLIEYWQGRESRLHDRLQYTLKNNANWKIERLAP